MGKMNSRERSLISQLQPQRTRGRDGRPQALAEMSLQHSQQRKDDDAPLYSDTIPMASARQTVIGVE